MVKSFIFIARLLVAHSKSKSYITGNYRLQGGNYNRIGFMPWVLSADLQVPPRK
ncbi:hypothetical protein ASZ90_005987 [hydrocarbon metagenome]|uniref:Uncharacterized protein n=1 Tax=hydrocarbon metagenome TaxID=938273 RepID=A0A0W8FTE5_9ZZZZ